MNKKEFINYLNEIFRSFGFKKNGNNWYMETQFLRKIISLQKSNYGNYYYINYGWILKNLDLPGSYHIGGRLASIDKDENNRIDSLLNLDKDIENRRLELYNIIVPELIEKLQLINTEDDMLEYIKSLTPPLSKMVPGIVKKHFNLL